MAQDVRTWKCPYCGGINDGRSCPGCGCMRENAPKPRKLIGHWCGEPVYDHEAFRTLVADYARTHAPGSVNNLIGDAPMPRPIIPPQPEPDGAWIVGEDGVGWAEAAGAALAMAFALVVFFITKQPACLFFVIIAQLLLGYILLRICSNAAD